jgi:hypothetical protein
MRQDDTDDDNPLRHGWPASADAGADGRGTNGAYAYQSDEEDEAPAGGGAGGGRWVSHGGVLAWEEPAEGQASAENDTDSRWAADELQLPPGAPAGTRIRAVRAWLLARRQAENEALGMLLLEQRRMSPPEEETRFARRGLREESPLELAMVEYQAAADEYERLYETLADLETHNGPQRLLVEFYLAVGDRLAELANAPDAPIDFAPELRAAHHPPGTVSARAASEWQGRASAVLHARRRVERVTAPETEE